MKINIACILSNAPEGTVLYDKIRDINVTLKEVDKKPETRIWCNYTDDEGNIHTFCYSKYGTLAEFPNGELILLPSRNVINWEGCITFENRYDNGDIITITNEKTTMIAIVNEDTPKYYKVYALYDVNDSRMRSQADTFIFYKSNESVRKANGVEVEQLFHALLKRNLYWDAKNKHLIPIPEPFEKVLVRDDPNMKWNVNFFGYFNPESEFKFVCAYNAWKQCIPYEGNAYVLGTEINK